MQVRVKAAGTFNYDGQILDADPSVIYDGAFAAWLRGAGVDVEVIEDDAATPVAATAKKTATAKKRADGDRHAD